MLVWSFENKLINSVEPKMSFFLPQTAIFNQIGNLMMHQLWHFSSNNNGILPIIYMYYLKNRNFSVITIFRKGVDMSIDLDLAWQCTRSSSIWTWCITNITFTSDNFVSHMVSQAYPKDCTLHCPSEFVRQNHRLQFICSHRKYTNV